ncbi:phosphoribosyl transferase domain protein [Penicillium chermesinum]|uniref:Phosphoribosyl transferase domain protein n=1 Tax=Penicillium chermesinum TaxID=63820 RepID=A0A9W9N7S3_9EURO|nr:phosphoribosyl transferase domain protein [Penicillium chermesinum]KAJ5214786.1 phosphoribosyl transferase domain protein [Penicillium chermesinum]
MFTLDSLKEALLQASPRTFPEKPISEEKYRAGFDELMKGSELITYREFIIPQLSRLLEALTKTHKHLSVLEIGPGAESVLGHLPKHQREKVGSYVAFEPVGLLAAKLKNWLCSKIGGSTPFPNQRCLPIVHEMAFHPRPERRCPVNDSYQGRFHIILFCHSIKNDLPEGMASVTNRDEELNNFACLVAGFAAKDDDLQCSIQERWRDICRECGDGDFLSNRLFFRSPTMLATFTKRSVSFSELAMQVPLRSEKRRLKNREASDNQPTAVLRPTTIRQIQQCILWAIKHGFSLSIIGGGHSGHCVRPNVVAIDMEAFDQLHIVPAEENESRPFTGSRALIVAGAGCKTGDITRRASDAHLTIPLGARPSVGAGLWLQGGIGHLTRTFGLTCDAIVGVVMVGVESGQVLCIGDVPSSHQPADAIRPEYESDLLPAIKGAGTNFGIVLKVVFRTFPVPTYHIREWVLRMKDQEEAILKLGTYTIWCTDSLPLESSADFYLYVEADQLCLGVTVIELSTQRTDPDNSVSAAMEATLGAANTHRTVDSLGLFDVDMYMHGMHGGHGKGKTSSFKRCVFLRNMANPATTLVKAIETRPTPMCYLHLLQGGEAAQRVATPSAFSCRNWDYACVVTGIWPREDDHTALRHSVVDWVYQVTAALLPFSDGVYGADLGPDPRDKMLACRAFGANLPALACLKRRLDPHGVLVHACPLREPLVGPKLIIMVSGSSGAGKDYCADVWSISDKTKCDYAVAAGADRDRLLCDREYKEHHRASLTAFFRAQLKRHPQLLEEHFLQLVATAADIDVLLISGMRDEAPVSTYSPLVPRSRLLEIHVSGREEERTSRQGHCNISARGQAHGESSDNTSGTALAIPSLEFYNDESGPVQASEFARKYILPFLSKDLQRLADMVRSVSGFPRSGVTFQHVLNIVQVQSGLPLCAHLMKTHFVGDWTQVHRIVCCEVGSFPFASALGTTVDIPLVLIREAGKLPPPIVSVHKPKSHIASCHSSDGRIEMDPSLIPSNTSIVIVDDVLATGRTLCATIDLLRKARVMVHDISVMVVAEFPIHRGRELLRQRGYGGIRVQSLLVFDGA